MMSQQVGLDPITSDLLFNPNLIYLETSQKEETLGGKTFLFFNLPPLDSLETGRRF